MTQWYVTWPQRLEMEKYLMRKLFPQLRLETLDDGSLCWYGPIKMPSGREFNIAIAYPKDFPISSPRVYPVDADAYLPKDNSHLYQRFRDNPHAYHRFADGSLCIHFPAVESPKITGADLAKMAILWLQSFEVFIESGSWPYIDSNTLVAEHPISSITMDTKDMVFVSYSHKDARWLRRLQIHLKSLERNGRIDIWDDTRLSTGDIWRDKIKQAINQQELPYYL